MHASRLIAQHAALAQRLERVVGLTGTLAIFLGGVVLVGWYTHSTLVARAWPTFVLLPYTAALCFMLCGLGLLGRAWGWTRLGIVCSIVAAALGLCTLYEYLFGFSLGLDRLFLQPGTPMAAGAPVRMAPQTALSFLLTGTALVVLCLPMRHELTLLLPGLLGLMVFGFGAVAGFGYLLGIPTAHSWQPFTDMVVQTAAGCIILGTGVLAATWRRYDEVATGVSPWTPVLVGLCVTAAALGLWQALLAREHGLIKHTVALAAASIQDAITEQIVSRLRSLERMAQHWASDGQVPKALWEQDVALARRHDPYLRNIAWVDPAFQFLWLAPLADEDVLPEQSLGAQTRQRLVLERARETQEAQVMRVGEAGYAAQELWVAVPLFMGTEFGGCLVGMLRLQPLLTQIVGKVVDDFALLMLEEHALIYAHNQNALRYKETLGQEMVLHLPGLTWRVWLWPTAVVLTNQFFVLPFAGLLMGLLTAVLLVSLTYYAQTAQLRATQLTITNEALQQEISERQRTESALRQLSKVYRDATDPIVIEDLQGQIIDLNVEAERAYGWTRAELLGQASKMLVPPENHPQIDACFARCQAGTMVRNIESVRWTKTGERVPVLLTLSLLTDDTAAPTAVATLAKHITELKRVAEALQESYQFLQSTLDALSASLVIVEETGTIVAVNASWSHCVAAHGLPGSAHGVGTNYLAFCRAVRAYTETATQEIAAGIRAVMAREKSTFACEYTCRNTTEPSWFLMRVTRFDGAKGVRVVVAHEDISEIKRAEETLRRHQEALVQSEKLAAMSGLLASVAHELNNPLAVIMVQSDVLREHVTESDLEDLATEINQSAIRCERIVRNFLTLARPNMPERTQVQLNEIIAEVLHLLSYTLQLDDIIVIQHLADDLPALWGDPHQLQQVVVNLVTNAQQAVHETLAPHQITITTRYDAVRQHVQLEVADSGPGVPPELQDRIFDPFFTTKPSGVGTGLGLPLCQSIVAGHGGSLVVQSQGGQGACFTMELPVGEVASPVIPAPEASLPAPITGKTLLVVDDEVGTTKALVRLFHRDGHTVDTAVNGHGALARLRAVHYDLILCDLRMPQLDGPTLYRMVAQEQPHLLQRFVFLTGDTLSPEARTFLEDSRAPYLVKPFRAVAVRQLVQQTLQRLEMA